MKKIFSVLCMMSVCAGAFAEDHDGAHKLDYSVFSNYRNMQPASRTTVLQTQNMASDMGQGWSVSVNRLSGTFKDMFGPAIDVQGNTNRERAQSVMNSKLSYMGIEPAQWTVVRDVQTAKAGYVDYTQSIDGHEVAFSRLSFRFTNDGKLLRVKTNNYGQPRQGIAPSITADAAKSTAAVTTDLSHCTVFSTDIQQDWVWFPIPVAGGYELHPAWSFTVKGLRENEMPMELVGYIDATNGELLYRSNNVNETFDVKVTGEVYATSPLVSPTTEPLQDMTVTIGGSNFTTDVNGDVTAPSANAPVNATYRLEGPWVRVRTGTNVPAFTENMTTSGATYLFPDTNNGSSIRHLTTFYSVNVVHDFMKEHMPNFSSMDNPMTANVDIAGNTCNAFYNGTINFYNPSGAGCRAFSEVTDIIYHEYGHGISRLFYAANGASFSNGALGEANSDIWAIGINKDGVVGEGSFFNGGNIRSYVGAPKVYPQDIVGEVHGDGEIIAGAWWDVAQNIGSIDTMIQLFAGTYDDLPNGPNGTEGEVYHDVLISALLNDDNDNNLSNGTPHAQQIVSAFARHGIYLFADAIIDHDDIPNPSANTAIPITAKLTLTNSSFFSQLYLFYSNRDSIGVWDSVAMNNTGNLNFTAQIPAQKGGTIMDYYFKITEGIASTSYGLPSGYDPSLSSSEVTIPFQFGVGINAARLIVDFETPVTGWDIGLSNDNASGGQWIQAVPIGSTEYGAVPAKAQIQTDGDHTTGSGQCLVTGNASNATAAPGSADVDNGKTTVMTPIIDLPFYEPTIEYYRWYSNDRGSNGNARTDYWQVQINTGLSVIWQNVEYTKQSEQKWRRRIFKVSEYLPNATQIRMRFIAEDRVLNGVSSNGQDVVEAAIDDFIIYEGASLSVENTPSDISSRVYPNPANNVVNVELPKGSKGSVSLYDITGKVLIEQTVNENENNYSLNTSSLAPGTYMVLVQTQYAVQNTKVVVSHN